MKTKTVIDSRYLPTNLPVGGTVLAVLALDFWDAPGWLWGACGLLLVLVWIGAVAAVMHERDVPPSRIQEE